MVHDTHMMKCGIKVLARSTALTKYTSIHLPSETLNAVSFLVYTPEVVSPCGQ
jgi:hypothetical protein